jgi:bifunctional DNA-binding transcriptional regulator/antitoxin component of YhaV-PrlF toxin-antitoxin module
MGEVIFKDGVIQTGYRVKIPKSVIDTLGLKIRQKVVLKFDPDKRILILEEDKEEESMGGKRKK